MLPFDIVDFLSPLSSETVGVAVVLGLVMGVALNRSMGGAYATLAYLYWQAASGFVFFVPLALIRNGQGVATWERFLGVGVLWGIFIVGKAIGASLTRRYWR